MKRIFGDRRTALRYSLNGRAEFYLSERDLTLPGALVDVSKTGVSFVIEKNGHQLKNGEVGMLNLASEELPDSVTCFVSIARQIDLSDGLKLGLDFMSIDDENYAKVRAYLGLARVRAMRAAHQAG
jgi:hypothetical protein